MNYPLTLFAASGGQDIDATSGDPVLITDDDGHHDTLHPIMVTVEVLTATGILVPGTFTLGTNSPNYNNILGLTSLAGGVGRSSYLINTAVNVNPYEYCYANIVTPTTHLGGSHTFRVTIFGHFNHNV